MPFKDPEKRKQWKREYNKKTGYKHQKKFNASPEGKKVKTISQWKSRGIIFHDYHLLYEIYTQTTHCDICRVELTDGNGSSQKCLDHDHAIDDNENVRYVCCKKCNNRLG